MYVGGMTYKIHERIGEGAFATVYRAVGSSKGSNAVKVSCKSMEIVWG